MRDFSWKYFTMTGDVESYLLYKEIDHQSKVEPEEEEDIIPDDLELLS
ncbi:YqzL family protein [Paenibacillus flagellatus]|uniref:YqzL family protein n=1 Tax=Paenibacillus flagellatus TaxID=2211139 RepID=A0A2V5JZN1_9BACL|nr:YqzL family protein [Paenibacillus flagellatus]PYI51752.1 YqzL family protein [Paenibacillus flagellatus]